MSEQQPKLHQYFHNFMIYFAVWAYAAFAILYGVRHILSVIENGASYMALDIVLSVLLIAVGIDSYIQKRQKFNGALQRIWQKVLDDALTPFICQAKDNEVIALAEDGFTDVSRTLAHRQN